MYNRIDGLLDAVFGNSGTERTAFNAWHNAYTAFIGGGG
jgi:hypothetical protein